MTVELFDGRTIRSAARAVAVAEAIDQALRKLVRLLAEQTRRGVSRRRGRNLRLQPA